VYLLWSGCEFLGRACQPMPRRRVALTSRFGAPQSIAPGQCGVRLLSATVSQRLETMWEKSFQLESDAGKARNCGLTGRSPGATAAAPAAHDLSNDALPVCPPWPSEHAGRPFRNRPGPQRRSTTSVALRPWRKASRIMVASRSRVDPRTTARAGLSVRTYIRGLHGIRAGASGAIDCT
jgi:hypothetical protein